MHVEVSGGRPASAARWRARVVAVALALIFTVAGAGPASAHPLGNFTLNRYARIEVSAGTVRVHYVIDLAEIPSYQVRQVVDADPEGYVRREVEAVVDGIELELDGRPVELRAVRRELDRPTGEGGMRRVRIDAVLEAPLPPSEPDEIIEGRFTDGNQPDRIGWREVVVTARGDATLVESSVPHVDISDELRSYPERLLQDPVDVRSATFRFTPGTEVVPVADAELARVSDGPGDRLTDLVDRQGLTPLLLTGMMGVAALVGAGHALAPGHGKTVMAAYLVGTKGRPVDAVLLGLIVSAMHTTSVLLLGAVLFQVESRFALERLYPTLTVVSGVGVLTVGAWLAAVRLRALRAVDHEHDHHHVGEHRHHGHHGRHRHDLPAEVAPLSRRGLVLLATAGGIVPSPSAVIALVGAFTLGRIGLGLGLVLAFSLGLAATLTTVGLAFVLGSRALSQGMTARLTPVLPVLGAVALLGVGAALVVSGSRGF